MATEKQIAKDAATAEIEAAAQSTEAVAIADGGHGNDEEVPAEFTSGAANQAAASGGTPYIFLVC